MATPIALIQTASNVIQALGTTAQGVQAGSQIKDRWSGNVKEIDDRAPERVIKRNGPNIKDFGTLRKPLRKILDWLTNGYDVKGIGIHGVPGIGKTTIMSNLNDHNHIAKMFDIVIWLKVSKEEGKENLRREDLQQDIAQRLKLKRGGTRNPKEVAQRISMVLEKKRYLLLLDDVKEALKLSEIGIPDSNNGSKIVLTTRERPVCKWMNLNKEIKVEYLPINEAWMMFQNVVGNSINLTKDPKILAIAHKVCEECCGLPLLITKVASTFRFQTAAILWEGVLDDWRMWPVEGLEGIKELYERMRFCYNKLKDERFRKCFLYGALYPEDSEINTDSLLECWEAEDLLVRGNDGRTERVKAGYSTIDHLQDVSFLEKGKRDYHVTMEKFVRQVAFYISEDPGECKHLVKTNKKLSDLPDVQSWSEKKRISLGANELYRLPDSPNCSMLSTLFLQSNKVLKEIPSEFFNCMIELRVLDLSDTGITSLPSSLSILRKLKVLHLNNCKQLVELPSNIDGLEVLEFLDIHGSGINGIPSDIKKLKLLKHLWVSFGNGNGAQVVSFNYNMISELFELEELFIDFEKRQQCTDAVIQNIMQEVAKLEKFKKLRVCFPEMIVDVIDIGVVPPVTVLINVPEARALLSYIEGSSWKEVRKITSFQFFIGLELKKGEYCRHSNLAKYGKYVKYCNGVVSDKDDTPILEVLAEAEGLELVGHKDLTQLSDFVTSTMNKIKGFVIDGCAAIETIIDTGGNELLPNLDILIINNLRKLKSIWKVPPRSGCQASRLTTLVISNCKVLVNVCPPGAIQQLSVIQSLTIEKCDKVEEIFPRVNGLILPDLKELILLGMKNLSSICAIESLKLPSLQKLKILKCPSLRKLPFKRGNVMDLNRIEAEKNWWEALQWREQEDKKELEKFFMLLEI